MTFAANLMVMCGPMQPSNGGMHHELIFAVSFMDKHNKIAQGWTFSTPVMYDGMAKEAC